jgi:hypothetical protein
MKYFSSCSKLADKANLTSENRELGTVMVGGDEGFGFYLTERMN